jgi:hypothetical protein
VTAIFKALALPFLKTKFFVEFWGPNEGVYRQEVSFTFTDNLIVVPLDITFTAPEDTIIEVIQIVDEDNNPVLLTTPNELSPNLSNPLKLSKDDTLRFVYTPTLD